MKRFCVLLTIFILVSAKLFSQGDESWKVYDDSQVAVINITVDPAALAEMYANPDLDIMHICSVHFKNAYTDQVIDSVGLRLRGNTSRDSQKKSFKLSFNEYVKGRDLLGIEKLNLNGEHNDPSVMRAKLAWDLANKMGMISSRAAHTDVYINNKYYGIYISVEHIDEEFIQKNFKDDSGNLWKCLYPASLKYRSDEKYSATAYTLTTNQELNNNSQLARLIRILNNTPQSVLPDSIESLLNIKSVLQYFALNMLIGSWDDYRFNQNNYYLYCAPKENKFYWLPYDYDNTFGISWSNADWTDQNPYTIESNRPAAFKLLSDPQYRNLYTHFLEFYNANIFKVDSIKDNLERLRHLISGHALNDTFRVKDYSFMYADFLNSYSETSYNKYHVKTGLKEFIVKRGASLATQLNYLSNAKPIIYEINWSPENPRPQDSIYITASAFSKAGIKSLSVNLKVNGSSQSFPLKYSPVQNTKKVEEADRWVGVIPPLGNAQNASFSITAQDINSLAQQYPRSKEIILKGRLSGPVVINELLASNTAINTDEFNEYEDWLELYNSSPMTIDLSGKYVTDNPANLDKWEIPSGTLLEPGKHLLIWCDEDSSQGAYHANFKLSVDGEFLALVDNDKTTILDSITFGSQITDVSFGRFTDGSENWQSLFPTPGTGNKLTSVDEDLTVPEHFSVSAYPNPFNPLVTISYTLPQVSDVSIKMFDMLGKEIFSVKENGKSAGKHDLKWNAADYSTGIYICTIKTENANKTIKLLLLK